MTCACVDYWAIMLPQLESLSGLQAVALHGKMKQVTFSKHSNPEIVVIFAF